MSPDAFLALAQEAFDALPEPFRAACEGVAILTPDLPDATTLAAMEIEDPYDLLGLYSGVARPFKSVLQAPDGPDMVMVYRLPVLAYAEDEGFAIADVVRHVLIHEIGHHLGFSDDDMEAIEAADDQP
ncbi:MAG: metallopeptidase family protein [Hyphomicrobiaceae bacterium]